MKEVKEIDAIIKKSLQYFLEGINTKKWIGRENEAVNLFVFSYLVKEIKPNSILFDSGQIGIEVAVPQINSTDERNKQKTQVRKDLVIWGKPFMTCWDEKKNPTNCPISILEWKFMGFREKQKNRKKGFEKDIKWLKDFSRDKVDFVGYAILLDISSGQYKIKAVKIYRGKENNLLL
jgi:hypothetical protein